MSSSSTEQPLLSPAPERRRCWRLFFESALALQSVLDTELVDRAGISMIERHFSQHLTDAEIDILIHALEKVSAHARPLRPGRIKG